MNRDLDALAAGRFDLLVVGAGITGAFIAWDAALRGLRVALLDRGDFGAETSSNSLKIIHGGLRYLQSLDLPRLRESCRERRAWLRMAPHLVEPLPVLVPITGHGKRGRLALGAALAVNDALTRDRNEGVLEERRLPPDRLLSKAETLELVPELEAAQLKGGALFHDAQMYSSERLVLEVVQAAAEAGAVVANYVEAESSFAPGDRFEGIWARDALGGARIPVRGRIVANATGPGIPETARRLIGSPPSGVPRYSLALNLVLPPLGHRVAFAVPGRGSARQLFFVPWRGQTLVGTAHAASERLEPGDAGDRLAVERFLDEVRQVWPGVPIGTGDVRLVHRGLIPAEPAPGGEETARLPARHCVVDHTRDGAPHVLSAVTIKFTTGRRLAEEVVDIVVRRLRARAGPCRTAVTSLPGGAIQSVGDLLREASATAREAGGGMLEDATLEHLIRTYGSRYRGLFAYRDRLRWGERVVEGSPAIRAQLVHGAREEVAQKPEDLLLRRCEIGARGLLNEAAWQSAREALAGGA